MLSQEFVEGFVVECNGRVMGAVAPAPGQMKAGAADLVDVAKRFGPAICRNLLDMTVAVFGPSAESVIVANRATILDYVSQNVVDYLGRLVNDLRPAS